MAEPVSAVDSQGLATFGFIDILSFLRFCEEFCCHCCHWLRRYGFWRKMSQKWEKETYSTLLWLRVLCCFLQVLSGFVLEQCFWFLHIHGCQMHQEQSLLCFLVSGLLWLCWYIILGFLRLSIKILSGYFQWLRRNAYFLLLLGKVIWSLLWWSRWEHYFVIRRFHNSIWPFCIPGLDWHWYCQAWDT